MTRALPLLLLACSQGPQTLGEACADFVPHLCSRMNDCVGDTLDYGDCVRSVMPACCDGEGCAIELEESISGREWMECLDGVDEASCQDIEAGVLPSECYFY